MKQTISGPFPKDSNSFIAQDWFRPSALNQPGETFGAASSQQLSGLAAIVPTTTPRATLLSWSVSAYLGYTTTAAGDVSFGRFGKIVAGLSPTAVGQVRGANNQPWSVALPAAPQDATLTETLWDPAANPMPPWLLSTAPPAPQGLLPVTVSQNLANPWPLDPGSLPTIAVWMWPSLLGMSAGTPNQDFFGLSLLYGSWTVNYDDGLSG